MHRLIRYITLLFCFAVVMMPLACSDDNDPGGGDTPSVPDGTPVDVRLRLQVASPSSLGVLRTMGTRQTKTYDDANATADEMMKSWVVVAVKSAKASVVEGTSKIAAIYHQSSVGNLEKDIVAATLTSGATYTFYAFANLTDDQLKAIGVKKADDATNTTDFDDDGWLKAGATLPEFSKKALLIKGNTTPTNNITDTTQYPNGIPMSSEAVEYTISASSYHTGSTEIDRYVIPVVRMVAKVRVVVTNNSDVALKVGSIQLLGLTANDQSVTTSTTDPNTNETTSTTTIYPNLMLMPGQTPTPLTYPNDAPTPTNRRATNLYSATGFTRKTETATYTVPEADRVVPAATEASTEGGASTPGTKTYEFYVNESETSDADGFTLQLWNYDESGNYSVVRAYVFTDFTRIARNEIHVLPITLERYRPEFTVEAFTAIGVVPQVTTKSGYVEIDLGTYGAFHLTPIIMDWLTGKVMTITGTPTPPQALNTDQMKELGINADTETGAGYPTFQWNSYAKTPTMELSVGNYDVRATYNFQAKIIDPSNSSETVDIHRYFRLINHAIDFSDPDWAKRWRGGVKQ